MVTGVEIVERVFGVVPVSVKVATTSYVWPKWSSAGVLPIGLAPMVSDRPG
jgi:hypothetical protein